MRIDLTKEMDYIKDQMDDTAGTIVDPEVLKNLISHCINTRLEAHGGKCHIEYQLPKDELLKLVDKCETQHKGLLAKDSTIKYIVEKLVNKYTVFQLPIKERIEKALSKNKIVFWNDGKDRYIEVVKIVNDKAILKEEDKYIDLNNITEEEILIPGLM